ncbi:hypothetical protein [Streptomyces sp. NPDC060035]|uniref:hypothetical protein n=1 Tax=Streptomyces sp. NPDC060035 TaxID=3347044 RepID=UPI0036853023
MRDWQSRIDVFGGAGNHWVSLLGTVGGPWNRRCRGPELTAPQRAALTERVGNGRGTGRDHFRSTSPAGRPADAHGCEAGLRSYELIADGGDVPFDVREQISGSLCHGASLTCWNPIHSGHG